MRKHYTEPEPLGLSEEQCFVPTHRRMRNAKQLRKIRYELLREQCRIQDLPARQKVAVDLAFHLIGFVLGGGTHYLSKMPEWEPVLRAVQRVVRKG